MERTRREVLGIGAAVAGNADLSRFLVLETSPGDTVVRGGEEATVDVTLGSRPDLRA